MLNSYMRAYGHQPGTLAGWSRLDSLQVA